MYRLTEEGAEIARRAARVAGEVIAPAAAETDRSAAFPRASLEALAREGFYGLTVPAAYGGMGRDLRTACAVLDEIARRCASTAMIYQMHLCAVATYVAAGERMADLLREVAAGRHLATLAWSEVGSRSHFWAPVSRAARNGTGVTIRADKSFVTAAGEADGYVVSTGWAEAETPLDTMLYLVRADDAGVRVRGRWDGLGMRGNASCPMVFEDVRVDAARALSEEGRGLDVMLGVVLPSFMAGCAAISLGICEAAVETTRRHLVAARNEHLGTNLAAVPSLRVQLARMRLETDRARAHLVAVLDALESPGPATQLLVLESKAAAGEAAITVTDLGMRACGGAAYARRLDLERSFRDARASAVMAPTTEHIHDFIGRALCGMELF
ncbi:MAG TPA: acyl-CoA dehydrogenase family protein [Longimicrobiales bacterium]|nr:acyl-CoA dehydrogenase family protein [Longimicrobiales bacterium]